MHRKTAWKPGAAALLLLVASTVAADALATARSSLSRWLSGTALPELTALSAGHPRLRGSVLAVNQQGQSALDEAIATVLREGLAAQNEISLLIPSRLDDRALPFPGSIDDIDCSAQPGYDHSLQVQVRDLEQGRAEVSLQLLDIDEPQVAVQSWHWRGRLSDDESRSLAQPPRHSLNNGSLAAPWDENEMETAALSLSEQLACSLRPQINDYLELAWEDHGALPPALADVLHDTRRRLARYREIGQAGRGADYQVSVRLEALQGETWQLWLAGTPARNGMPAIQAVTYIRAPSTLAYTAVPETVAAPLQLLTVPAQGEPASKFLEVHMLEASQSDRRFAGADLRLRLRLVNLSAWPMEYGLSLSGGHYQHCIPEPGYYRHDRYGYLQGRLSGGQSAVRVMTIEGAGHNPNPWFGARKCAGFSGLEGFEDFARNGHRVTQFIRWDM